MKVLNNDYLCVVDTGSAVSIVNEAVVPVNTVTPYCGPELKSATGDFLTVVGKVDLLLNDAYLNSFVVVKNFRFDILIGLDLLKKYNAKINVNKDLTLDGATFKFLSDPKVSLPCNCIVPAKSEIVVRAQVNPVVCPSDPVVLVEPSVGYRVSFARTLSPIRNGFVYVNCVNNTNEDVLLYAGSTVGVLETYSVDISQPDTDVEPTSGLETLVANAGVSLDEKKKLFELLNKYKDIFSLDGKFGRTDLVKHKINTSGTPISKKPYRTSVKENEVIKKEVNKMLSDGVIEPSSSPWSAPVVLVKKKDGKIRFCVDYRSLNDITVKDVYPLPLVNDAIECLGGCVIFSTLDLVSGYWQVEVAEEDRPKTAFITREGLYQFKTMPFGLANAPATFQRLMDLVISGLKWKKVMVYLDDIVIFSKNFNEHLLDLEEVFNRLRDANLKVKPSKCSLAKSSIKYLGHVISAEGISMDKDKVKAVNDFPIPKNMRQLQTFLGLTGYYRRFIKDYAKIAKPLFDLLKKNQKFIWNEEAHNAFNKLKDCLISTPILNLPDFSKEFTIFCDASGTGIGSVLSQVIDGKEKVIGYYSKMLTEAERKWTTLERECFSLLSAIKHFRSYVYGTKFNVVVDNNPLTWLKTAQFASSRLMRWATELQSYDFDLKYRAGKSHSNADALSRAFDEVILINSDVDRWKELQNKDFGITKFLEKKKYVRIDGLVYYISTNHHGVTIKRLVVPDSLKNEMLVWSHDHPTAAHLGFAKTLERIKTKYYWNNYRREIEEYLKNCDVCARRKPSESFGTLSGIAVGEPFEMVAVDVVGPLPVSQNGNKYILVFSDYLTRYPEAFPLKDYTTESIAKILVNEVVLRYGFPAKLLSDRGTSFLSKVAQCVYKLLNVEKINTTSYHPQTDGLVERFNKTLVDMLSKLVNDNTDNWDELIPFALYAYRTAIHASTKYTPFELMFGRVAKSPVEIVLSDVDKKKFDSSEYGSILTKGLELIRANAKDNLQAAQLKQKLNYDKDKSSVLYNVGDLVYLKKERRTSKFDVHWIGPFVVIKKITDINYRIREVDNKRKSLVVHISKIKPYIATNDKQEEETIIEDSKSEISEDSEIEDSLESNFRNNAKSNLENQDISKLENNFQEIQNDQLGYEKKSKKKKIVQLEKEEIVKVLDRMVRKVKNRKRKYYKILLKNGTSRYFSDLELRNLKDVTSQFDLSLSE